MAILSAALLTLVGLIHLLPVVGVPGGERLQSLYGVTIDDPSLLILMRHRAVLFAIVGAVLIAGALHSPWRGLALVVGLISVVSFLVIAAVEGGANPAIQRVVWIDYAALAALLIVAGIEALSATAP